MKTIFNIIKLIIFLIYAPFFKIYTELRIWYLQNRINKSNKPV